MRNRVLTQAMCLFLSLLFLASCDCYIHVKGTVVDSKTQKPIKGVVVYNKNKPTDATETDSLGNFELTSISGGIFRVPPMKVATMYIGFKEVQTKIKGGEQKIIELEEDASGIFYDPWVCFDLKDSITLKVIKHRLAPFSCGIFATAASTVGTTATGDTIRVLELCNQHNDFKKGELVKVVPHKKPDFGVSFPFTKQYDEKGKELPDSLENFLKTTYGTLKKITN